MAKLQIKYVPLFSLSIKQLFYRNNICRKYQINPELDIDVVPVAESNDLLRRKDMVFRAIDKNGGIIILANVQGKNADGNDMLRYRVRPEEKLTFGLILKNPNVLHYNDLPIALAGNQTFYFSNEVNDPAASRDALHLSKDVSGVKPEDLIKTTTSAYRYHSLTPVAGGDAFVKHLLTGATVMPAALVNEGGEANISFNLDSLPSGKCELLILGSVAETFYYTGAALRQPFFGVVEIMLSAVMSQNYRAIEADSSLTPERPVFEVTFKNRRTVWRYTFQIYKASPLYLEIAALNPADRTAFFQKLNIVSNDAAVTFRQTNATDETIIFESENALYLEEKYFISGSADTPLRLMLEKYIGEAGEKIVRDNLPHPSTGLIDTTTPSFIYSDIFITI